MADLLVGQEIPDHSPAVDIFVSEKTESARYHLWLLRPLLASWVTKRKMIESAGIFAGQTNLPSLANADNTVLMAVLYFNLALKYNNWLATLGNIDFGPYAPVIKELEGVVGDYISHIGGLFPSVVADASTYQEYVLADRTVDPIEATIMTYTGE